MFQYLQAFEAMARVDEKGYGKFTDMAKHAYEALKTGMDMRDDLFIVVSTHSENTGDNLNPYYRCYHFRFKASFLIHEREHGRDRSCICRKREDFRAYH